MAVNGLSIGKDVSVALITSYGPVNFNITTSFHPKAKYHDLRSVGLDGTVRDAPIPAGWDITFKIDRGGASVDAYFAQVEADYFAGVPTQAGTILETITEPDGTVSQWRYDNVMLKYDDAGERVGDKTIQIGVHGTASRRIQVA